MKTIKLVPTVVVAGVLPLPANAVMAEAACRVSSRVAVGAPDHGIFITKKNSAFPALCTWGLNATRETVEKYSGRQFVCLGASFEEIL